MEERRLRQVNTLSAYYIDESREFAVIWFYNLQDFHELLKEQFSIKEIVHTFKESLPPFTVDGQ